MAARAYGSDVRGRKAKSAFKARILRRLGDYLIHHLRAAQPLAIATTTPPSSGDDVNVRHRAFCFTKSESSNFNRAYGKSLIAVLSQISQQEIKTPSLERWPLPGAGHGLVVLVWERDCPEAETFPEIVHQEEGFLQKSPALV